MAHSVETNQMQCVFVETNFETRLGLLLHNNDDVFTIKGIICKEHIRCFPSYGDITVSALKVKRSGQYYQLADSVILTKAFEGNDKFINVDVLCVDAKGQAATSNRQLLDSKPYNPTIKDGLTLTPQVAEKESKKRKTKSLLSDKKSRKKPVGVEANQKDQLVENVNKIQEHESLSGVMEKENEMGNKEDGEKDGDEAKSMKARKKPKSKSAKIVVVEDTLVTPGALNVEAENVLKDVNKSQEDEFLSGAMEKAPTAGDNLLTAETLESTDAEKEGLKVKDRVDADVVSFTSSRENGMGTKDNGEKDVKARKKSKSKIVKSVVKEDTVVASGAHNLVKDSEDNVEKVVKKSSKRSKKTQVVEEA